MELLLRCWRGSNVAVGAMWLAWWSLVEWWLSKIKKVKEKRYLKITSPMNHMIPSIQQDGTYYTSTYRNI